MQTWSSTEKRNAALFINNYEYDNFNFSPITYTILLNEYEATMWLFSKDDHKSVRDHNFNFLLLSSEAYIVEFMIFMYIHNRIFRGY